MAQSFWSKRQQTGSYAQSGTSNARVWVVTIVGIFIVGLLMYGVFAGSKWAYSRLTSPDRPVASTQNTPGEGPTTSSTQAPTPTAPTTTIAPSTSPVTITSSTTTSTPQTASQPNGNALPNTGPGNWGALFVVSSSLAYVLYRRKLTRSR